MAGLFITSEPQIFGINSDDDSNTAEESTSARILWPLCFALGFLPIGLMNVICEKELKTSEVRTIYYCMYYYHSISSVSSAFVLDLHGVMNFCLFVEILGKIIQLYNVVTVRSDHLYGVLVLGRFYPRIWNGMCFQY
jgi:hypothetical protein